MYFFFRVIDYNLRYPDCLECERVSEVKFTRTRIRVNLRQMK